MAVKTEITACLKHNKIDNKSVVCGSLSWTSLLTNWLDVFRKTVWHNPGEAQARQGMDTWVPGHWYTGALPDLRGLRRLFLTKPCECWVGDSFHPNVFQGFCPGGASEQQLTSLPCHWAGSTRKMLWVQSGEVVGKSLARFLQDVTQNRRKSSRGHLSRHQRGCRRQELVGTLQQSSGGQCRPMAGVGPGLPGKGALRSPGNALQGGGREGVCRAGQHNSPQAKCSGSALLPSPHHHRGGYRRWEVGMGESQGQL